MDGPTMERLPMFPLGAVVLPGEVLPLRVFEPRYRRLVLDCLGSDDAVFGTALIERGSEVGGHDQRSDLGTFLRIGRLTPVPGGRFELLAVAVERLRVVAWLPDDPYPIAVAELWPDPGTLLDDIGERLGALAARVAEVRELAIAVAAPGSDASRAAAAGSGFELADDPVRASYQLAGRAPFGPADRHRVLQADTVEARLDIIGEALDDVEAALRFRLA
jgi:uncharacterized protein